MPANTFPIFTGTPRTTVSRLTTFDSSRDGALLANTASSFTAGISGSRLDFITFVGSAVTGSASTAKVCRVFLTDATGSAPRLISEVALATVTPSATAIGTTSTITFTNGLVIGSGQIIKTSMSAGADQVDVLARGGDFTNV
jgi:hypothetical protein